MRPQKQAFLHQPDQGVYGDCYRTAIACLLDLDRDSIPHRHEDWSVFKDECGQWRDMQKFLTQRGLCEINIPFTGDTLQDILNSVSHHNPGLHWMLTGTSMTGVNHVVICKDAEIVWDPSLTDAGIMGPCDDGFWWVSFLGRIV